jgi:phage gp36-like protein
MPYSTKTDIEYIFGVANVITWSQLDRNVQTADATRIALAIQNADDEIDSIFYGSRYIVPFSGTNVKVTDWSAKLAGVWLYTSRAVNNGGRSGGADDTDRVTFLRASALQEMDLYTAGARKFGPTVATVRGGNTPYIVPTRSIYTEGAGGYFG